MAIAESGRIGRWKSRRTDLDHGTDLLDDCVFVGELAGFLLGVDPFSIDIDLIHAAAGGNNLQRSDILPEIQQLGRQTDGARCVVSSRAIFNAYLNTHGQVLIFGQTVVKYKHCGRIHK